MIAMVLITELSTPHFERRGEDDMLWIMGGPVRGKSEICGLESEINMREARDGEDH